ncbi:hypothetical protein FKM82_028092 [Ascaphus truei]
MDQDDAKDYPVVKEVLLARYAITPETYRTQFRAMNKGCQDTHLEFMSRLEHQSKQWMAGCEVTTFKALHGLMVKEQFMLKGLSEV